MTILTNLYIMCYNCSSSFTPRLEFHMQTFFQFFGKFLSLVIATFIIIIIVNLIFRMIMRIRGDSPNFEFNSLGALMSAGIIGVIFFLASMFYGPFSFITFK